MSISIWFRNPRIRRGIALSAVVLATGGLVLHRSASALPGDGVFSRPALTAGKSSAVFSGPGVHGMVSLSHTHLLTGQDASVFADVRVVADAKSRGVARAPISLAVVLDTSGSMSGEKIEDAKRSVLELLSNMRDDDEIALVRYDDRSELVQQLARVGAVRASLSERVREIVAGGGTNIPGGLSHGLRALDEAARGRVRRIVLVSDGLDATRAQAENLARSSFASGITVSSLGIGLDFDESYMGSLAQNGHGNFGFIKEGGSLAKFLHRELEETATTTVEHAHVRLRLPNGMRFVHATGADVVVNGGEVDLSLGSLFAGDERRVIVEMTASASGSAMDVETEASWNLVGAGPTTASAPRLTLLATADASEVERGKDGAVLASAASVLASRRQMEAANAYAQGDVARAAQITADNERALASAEAAAPASVATALGAQRKSYEEMKKSFAATPPRSDKGRAAAKAAAAKEMGNLSRSTVY
ncbi:MAG: VWA domain-containing protein [Labilithrix sp.]|nr:VWA domain-containing protein [Labilithrix sp.]